MSAVLHWMFTMYCRIALLVSLAALAVRGQTVCQPTPAYSTCEIAFELSAAERSKVISQGE